MRLPSVAKLVGDEIKGHLKWSSCVTGADDNIYGIPCHARRVIKFNPVDKSTIEIGPDLGPGMWKWQGGVLAGNGCIYCIRCGSPNAGSILKIDTIHGTVTLLHVRLPETGPMLWASGALALDGCIYYMPAYAFHILKFNPEDNTVASVGDHIAGEGWKCIGTVADNDGYLYGIPNEAKHILRFNPSNQEISRVGGTAELYFRCRGNGVSARDGFIYAANNDGKVLKIDVANDSYLFVGNTVKSSNISKEWGDAISGDDGCIYWPPCKAKFTLKFDPESQITSLVGDEFGSGIFKWTTGASSSDRVIYCLPINATHVLAIDPFKELVITLQVNMQKFPEKLGLLFVQNKYGKTTYENAVTKFGKEKVFQAIAKCIPSSIACAGTRLPSFFVAASCENSAVSLIYYLIRKDPSSVNEINYYIGDNHLS
jgi:hypothetical protein